MFDAASGATDSVPGCGRAPGEPSSSAAARRNGAASLPRPYRSLRRSIDIRSVRRSGVRRRADGVTVVVAPGVPGAPRVAFIAGRDVGGAVRRNRVKRRLREAVALAPLAAGHDYVVVGTGPVAELPFLEVVGRVREAVGE